MSFEKIDMTNDIRPDEPNKILIYGYEENERELLINVFKKENIPNYMFVEKTMLNKTVSELVYNDNFDIDPNLNANFPHIKFMLISGFSHKELNNLFSILKTENIKRPIAATVTIHNINWSFKHLIKDVYEEHLVMMEKVKKMKNNNANA